ncbi:hypothetical protein PSCLAVI8L_130463 [Pseudoclavibacter sp. 8L]|nr:hypothetical protein PSCLAVI8L_130463 [Pseudoclavibacter sp. 8L]
MPRGVVHPDPRGLHRHAPQDLFPNILGESPTLNAEACAITGNLRALLPTAPQSVLS